MLHEIELTLAPTDPTVLERVLTLCRSRGCPVVGLRFDADADGGRAQVTVDGDPRRVQVLAHRIDGLIGVLATAAAASAAPAATTR